MKAFNTYSYVGIVSYRDQYGDYVYNFFVISFNQFVLKTRNFAITNL